MHTINILYCTGELVRLSCTESDALRAVVELSARADVARAWHEAA
jgi:hypothetical protein